MFGDKLNVEEVRKYCVHGSVVLVRACNFSFSFNFSNLAQ